MTLCRRLAAALLALALGLAAPAAAPAADGTLRIVVGFAPGGSLDVLGRIVAEKMQESLGHPVIVENRPGAGGIVGNVAVKSAAPDGGTLVLVTSSNMVTYPFSHAPLPYSPLEDFTPVAELVEFPIAMGISTAVPAATPREFAALVKRDAKLGFCGSAAPGSLSHFFCLEFARAAGIELTHVSYKGSAPMGVALMAGEIPVAFSTPLDIAAAARSGKARFVAISAAARSPLFPDVPTFEELGYPIEGSGWYGLYAPAGTPAGVVARVAKAAIQAVKDPAIAAKLRGLGLEPTGRGPVELGRIMREDTAHWGPLVKASGFRASE